MFVVQESVHADPISRHETLADALQAVDQLAEEEGSGRAGFSIREVDDEGRTLRVVEAPGERARALTPRERQVLLLMTEGLTNRQIAERLDISRATVKVHVRHIFDKLGRLREPAGEQASTGR